MVFCVFSRLSFFGKFLWLHNKTENPNLFLVHTKDNQPKDQSMKSASNTRQASYRNIDSELPDLYWLYD